MTAPMENALDSIEQGDAEKAVASIITMLSNPESVESIREYGDTMKTVVAVKEQQQSQVQSIIQGLLALKDQESANVEAEKTSSHVDKTKEAEQALSDATQELEKIQSEVQAIQRDKFSIEEQKAGLLEQRERVKEETTQILPKTRYNISLYTCITGIKWDYECPPEQIKGYVSTSKDVRPFSLSSQKNSKFFITNYLWDLVDSACQAK